MLYCGWRGLAESKGWVSIVHCAKLDISHLSEGYTTACTTARYLGCSLAKQEL
jgi:hypothetical protein